MILYLDKENISNHTNNEINIIAKNNYIYFSDFISKTSKKYENNINWHLSSPLSRNPITSDFFYNICKILYVQHLSRNNKIEIVYVDNYYLKKNLEALFKDKKLKIINLNKFDNPIYYFLKKIIFFIKKLSFKIFQIILCRFLIKDKKLNNIILIEKFVAKDLFDNDRYYGNLIDLSSDKIKDKIYYLPFIILTNFINIIPVYLKIRKLPNYICKEKYVSFFDILYSCLFCFRIHKYQLNNVLYKDLNITTLFNGELLDPKGCDLAIEGIINYLFFKNIKKKNIKIDLIIDWWENQACDKGFSLGVKKYFKQINFISYLGYVPRDMEFHLSPTNYEIKLGLVSNNISIISKKFEPNINKLNKDINLIYSPSFRFNYLWDDKLENIKKNHKPNIFLVLPIIYNQSKNIIDTVLAFKKKYNQYKIYYKQHPSLRKKQKIFLDKLINKNFIEIKKNKNFLLSIGSKDIVVTSHSSAALESISLGIPIVILYDRNSLYFDPIPRDVLNYKYYSTNYKEFENTILKILEIDKKNLSINSNIKDEYFIKPTKKSTQNFFNQCYK